MINPTYYRIYVCYYHAEFPEPHNTWYLTHDINLAKAIDPTCHLATLYEVYEWGGLGGELPNKIRVVEGEFEWTEHHEVDEWGDEDCHCEYMQVN